MPALNNPHREQYVRSRVEGLTQRQAYYVAYPHTKKWKPETVDNKAYILEKKGEIKARYQELQKELAARSLHSAEEKRAILASIYTDPDADLNARIRAIDIDNKMTGEYTSKVEISGREKEQDKLENIIGQLWGNE